MNKAVIMAGGFGTRLRPLTMKIPKPMVPILNSPMVEHIVNLLKIHGLTDIVSLLYFQPEVITSYFENGEKFGVSMNYVMAAADYGTAGAVRNAKEYLDSRFIIISGDVLTDFDLTDAIKFHDDKGSKATILLTRVNKPLQYGIVMTDESGKITRFLEKPSWGQVFSDTINTGIYILEPEILDLIPFQEDFDFGKDLFPLMLEKEMPLYGYIAEGYWKDVGNLDEYQYGQKDGLDGGIKLQIKGTVKDEIIFGTNCKIAPSAKFKGKVVIGDNVVIGEHAVISDSVIGNNSTIGNGALLTRVTLWDNVKLGDFCNLTDDVICSGCHIGDGVIIAENVFISDNCRIGNKAKLLPNIKLWPDKHVQEGATLTSSLVQEDKWLRELFTDARISGLSNIEINPEFGAKLGTALGMTFGQSANLLASRDPDKVSRIMKRTIVAGLASIGVNVSDLQTNSIPQTRQELRVGKYTAGLHVRRSPRHPHSTDIIIFNKEGRDIQISTSKKIERFFFGEDIKRVNYNDVGNISYPERTNEIYINRYLSSLDKDLIKSRKFKILMDYSYGLASSIYPYILGQLVHESLSLHDFIDGSKYSSGQLMDNLKDDEAVKIMRSLGYELGFIMERGAEKISIIDERGVLYSPTRLLSIVTKLFLETNKHLEPYKIGVSITSGKEIDIIAKDYNVEVVRIKNSHSSMMEATKDESMRFVGGAFGGFIFSEFLFASDGMFSVGKILEMLARTGLKLFEVDEMIPRRHYHQIDVNCPWENKGTVMRKAMDHSSDMQRDLVDGIKVYFEDDSVLLIPDKERGLFTVIAESATYDGASTLAKKYESLVNSWRDTN